MSIWETPKEKQEEWIEKTFNLITKYEMEVPAVMFLESMKSLFWVGGQMSRVAAGPFLLAFWQDGFGLMHTFENRKNVEKLIKKIEEKHQREREEKERQKAEKIKSGEIIEEKGWRKYLKFLNL
jgi:hypothetical protein